MGQNEKDNYYSSPRQIPGTSWKQIRQGANWSSVIAIKTNGTLWSWGNNTHTGVLGQNNTTQYSSPRQVGTDKTWGDVSRGGNYHWFATKGDGTLWAVGNNSPGNLGLNDRTQRSSPTQIPGTTWKSVDDTERVTMASKTDGTLWIWGLNDYGALGLNQGPGTSRSSPTQMPGNWEGNKGEMSSGYWESYAIKSDLS